MKRQWSWPKWTLKYSVGALAVSAFFGLALYCADAATCTTGRLPSGPMVAGSFLILYLLIVLERYFRAEP